MTGCIAEGRVDRLMLAAFVAVCAIYCMTPVHNGNFFWHVRNGEDIIDTRSVRTEDSFTWTEYGGEWLQQEWLAEVTFAASWGLPGEWWPVGLKMLVIMTSILLTCLAARRLGARVPAIVTVGILWLALAHGRWIVRPHIFSILFFSIYLYLLARGTGGFLRSLLIFVPLQILWTNFHAGFVMGWFLLSLPVAERILRKDRRGVLERGGVLVAAILSAGIHPNGFRSIAYLTDFLSRPLFRETIREWWSPFHPLFDPGSPISRMALLLTVLLIATTVLHIVRRRMIDPVRTAALVLLAAASVFSSRNIDMLSLAAVAWTAPLLDGIRIPRWLPATMLAAATAVPLIIGVPRDFGPPRTLGAGVDWDIYPRGLTTFLEDNPELLDARVFNTNEISGYLEYELGGELMLFMDGRCHLYGEGLYSEYLLLVSSSGRSDAPTQLSILDSKGIDLALMSWPSRSGAVSWTLSASPDWSPVYWDDLTLAYARNSYLSAEGLEHLAFRHVDPLMTESVIGMPFQSIPSSWLDELLRASHPPMDLDQAMIPAAAIMSRRGFGEQALELLETGAMEDPLRTELAAALSGQSSAIADGRLDMLRTWALLRSGDTEMAAASAELSGDAQLLGCVSLLSGGPGNVPTSSPPPPMVPEGAWGRITGGTAMTGEERSAGVAALLMCGMEDAAVDTVMRFLADGVQLPPWGLSLSGGILALAGMDSLAAYMGDSALTVGSNPYTHSMRGTIAEISGDLDTAVEHYSTALAGGPLLHDTRMRRAECLWELGMLEEAMTDYHVLHGLDYLSPLSAARYEWGGYLVGPEPGANAGGSGAP